MERYGNEGVLLNIKSQRGKAGGAEDVGKQKYLKYSLLSCDVTPDLQGVL